MNLSHQTPPILLIGFNRPELMERVFDAIRRAQPPQLYFAVDGPRERKVGEREIVAKVRAFVDRVDWDCEIRTLFREENLGCKIAVSNAISWFFSHVESGVVLEDDCIPDPTFFAFTGQLLEYYRDDRRVMMISGDNFQFGKKVTQDSYYFSRYTHIWGWATWRRAWDLYDFSMTRWPELRRSGWLDGVLGDRKAARYWTSIFDETYNEQNDAWDYRWTYAAWLQGGLTILPAVNLVSNIGFGQASTNNWRRSSPFAALPTVSMQFPLDHPSDIARNDSADAFTQKTMFTRPLWRKIARAVYKGLIRRTGP